MKNLWKTITKGKWSDDPLVRMWVAQISRIKSTNQKDKQQAINKITADISNRKKQLQRQQKNDGLDPDEKEIQKNNEQIEQILKKQGQLSDKQVSISELLAANKEKSKQIKLKKEKKQIDFTKLDLESFQKNQKKILEINQNQKLSTKQKSQMVKGLKAENETIKKHIRQQKKYLRDTTQLLTKNLQQRRNKIQKSVSNSMNELAQKSKYTMQFQKKEIKMKPQSMPDTGGRGQTLAPIDFIKSIHGGRLIKGVYLGIKNKDYEEFLCRDDTSPLIEIDQASINFVSITNPNKISTKIQTNEFQKQQDLEEHKKGVELGTLNFSSQIGGGSLCFSAQVSASYAKSQETSQETGSQQQQKYYCMKKSFIVIKKQVSFNKYQLTLSKRFLQTIKHIEKNYEKWQEDLRHKIIWDEIFTEYGTHFYVGSYTIGGRYDYSVETKYSSNQSKEQARKAVVSKIQGSVTISTLCVSGGASAGSSDSSSSANKTAKMSDSFQLKQQSTFRGGSGSTAKDFMQSMSFNSSWSVLGQSKMEQSYIPIWELIFFNVPNVSRKFIDQIQKAYFSHLKKKLQLNKMYKDNKKQLKGSMPNKKLCQNNGTGFGMTQDYIGNFLEKDAHGVGMLSYQQRIDKWFFKLQYVGIWKKGIFYKGYCFNPQKNSWEKVDQQVIQNAEIKKTILEKDWEKLVQDVYHSKAKQINGKYYCGKKIPTFYQYPSLKKKVKQLVCDADTGFNCLQCMVRDRNERKLANNQLISHKGIICFAQNMQQGYWQVYCNISGCIKGEFGSAITKRSQKEQNLVWYVRHIEQQLQKNKIFCQTCSKMLEHLPIYESLLKR